MEGGVEGGVEGGKERAGERDHHVSQAVGGGSWKCMIVRCIALAGQTTFTLVVSAAQEHKIVNPCPTAGHSSTSFKLLAGICLV